MYQVGDSRSRGSLIPPCAHLRDVVRHGEVSCVVMFSLIRIGWGGGSVCGGKELLSCVVELSLRTLPFGTLVYRMLHLYLCLGGCGSLHTHICCCIILS